MYQHQRPSLPDKIDLLQKYDVGNITVTLNAIDPEIGAKIYQHVDYQGKRYTGIEGAKLLLSQQLKGIEEAVKRKMFVKINTVYIPGINEDHIPALPRKLARWVCTISTSSPSSPSTSLPVSPRHSPNEKEDAGRMQ